MNDTNLDHRLINSHHSLRVVDFAMMLQHFLKTKVLKNDKRLKMKFGICQGPIVSAVLGEIKPQFSLFGKTLNLAREACLKSTANRILVTKNTKKTIEKFSDLIGFYRTKICVGDEL